MGWRRVTTRPWLDRPIGDDASSPPDRRRSPGSRETSPCRVRAHHPPPRPDPLRHFPDSPSEAPYVSRAMTRVNTALTSYLPSPLSRAGPPDNIPPPPGAGGGERRPEPPSLLLTGEVPPPPRNIPPPRAAAPPMPGPPPPGMGMGPGPQLGRFNPGGGFKPDLDAMRLPRVGAPPSRAGNTAPGRRRLRRRRFSPIPAIAASLARRTRTRARAPSIGHTERRTRARGQARRRGIRRRRTRQQATQHGTTNGNRGGSAKRRFGRRQGSHRGARATRLQPADGERARRWAGHGAEGAAGRDGERRQGIEGAGDARGGGKFILISCMGN